MRVVAYIIDGFIITHRVRDPFAIVGALLLEPS
jgi:hypothetical protein